MPKPTEHKTVQARILAYAQEIGWSLVTMEEVEMRKGIGNWILDIKGCGKDKDSWSLDTPYFVARMICFKTEGACHV